MGYVDEVATRLGESDGWLYTQRTSRYHLRGVWYTRTSRYMTRPNGKFFNVMGGEAVLYENLPESIKLRAMAPKIMGASKRLTTEEHAKYANIQAGRPTKGNWVQTKKGGVVTYLPESQAVRPGKIGLGMILIGCAIALWYFLFAGRRR